MILVVSIAIFIGALLLVLIACECGQRFCNSFDETNDVLNQINFHLLPIDVQRLLPTVMIYAQEPLLVRFFGSLCLSREQFKKVNVTIDKRR